MGSPIAAPLLSFLVLLQQVAAAPYTDSNKEFNLNNRPGERDPRFYGWDEPGRTYFPSPDDWRRHPVYQVVVDRFFDGDPRNNAEHGGLIFDWRDNTGPLDGFDVRDLASRQGGDWRGLTSKLDYILGLGCRALWISPVQQNADNSPMGYLQWDKTLLERRFGNITDFRHLIDEAHKRGMYVVVDLVNNHMAELLDWVTGSGEDERMLFRMHHGGESSSLTSPELGKEPKIRPKAKVLRACERTPGCDPDTFQPYVDYPYDNRWYDEGKYRGQTFREAGFQGMPLGIEDVNGTGGYWNCSFHHSGEMPVTEEGPWNWPLGKLYGTLDDIRTTEDDVVDRLVAASVAIIAALDIDGFRLDTPRECAYSSWVRWRSAVDEAAKKLGKHNFGTWGELWSTPERAATYVGRGKDIPHYFDSSGDPAQQFINPEKPIFDGLINYNYFSWLVAVFRHNFTNQSYMVFNILEWETKMGYDIEWPSFPTNRTDKVPRYQMWNFCGSHDQHRMPQFPLGYDRLRLCHAWVYTWPGIPVTYQGDEQALVSPGSGLAYWGREFMATSVAWDQVPTEEKDGRPRNPAASDNFNPHSNYYRFYRRILQLRDAYWESSFACLGAEEDGRGLPDQVLCRDVNTGTVIDGILGYRRRCQEDEFGVVMLLNLEPDDFLVACDGLGTGHVQLFDALHQNDGPDSTYSFEPLPDVSTGFRIHAFQTMAVVDRTAGLPLVVEKASPEHDAELSVEQWAEQRLEVRFSEPVDPKSLRFEIDGHIVSGYTWEDGHKTFVLDMREVELNDESAWVQVKDQGLHTLEVLTAKSSAGNSTLAAATKWRVRVADDRNPLVGQHLRVDHSIIMFESDGVYLDHPAVGATFFRAQHAGEDWAWNNREAWVALPKSGGRTRFPNFRPGVPIVVQYFFEGSAAYLVTACRKSSSESCSASYYWSDGGKNLMAFRGGLNAWSGASKWHFNPPDETSGNHAWYLDIHISVEDSEFLIDVNGDQESLIGRGNDVTNPFFFPFETFCFSDLSIKPRGPPTLGCGERFWGALGELQGETDLCNCDMRLQTLFLAHSGLNYNDEWMTEHFPDFWIRETGYQEKIFHILGQKLSDASSGDYNLIIPASYCAVGDSCRIVYNDLLHTIDIMRSPPGVVGLGRGSLDVSIGIGILWIIVPFGVVFLGLFQRRRYSVVTVTAQEIDLQIRSGKTYPSINSATSTVTGSTTLPAEALTPRTVLVASVEHIIEHSDGAEKVVAGGLGKVAGLLCQFHPTALVCVHPIRAGVNYKYAVKVESISAVVSGSGLTCDVLCYERPPIMDGEGRIVAPSVVFFLVDHQIFRARADIYPVPQTRQATLEFYSLWNQVVARLIDRIAPDIYHCPDFHAAMAVMYLEKPRPTLVMLHNAEYQGAISTQHMGKKEAAWFGKIFDLPAERIQRETFCEGRFCMLKPVVDHIRTYQDGYGICAVSKNYALEAAQKHSVLWGLPEVRGIENCMPECERLESGVMTPMQLSERRRQAKASIQETYNLKQDPNARIFVFLGRWVKQKGVDYISDVAEWMLSTYRDSQLIMIGPIGDPYGTYAKEKMERLKRAGKYGNRMFVHADFLKVPQELKLACDFCLMPSRDEPFGYVDIEFAWFGAVIVGSLRGGLGKLPGFYFEILNSDSSRHMQRRLKKAISRAMACPSETLAKMSTVARKSSFPVGEWQSALLSTYSRVLLKFDWEAIGEKPPDHMLDTVTLDSSTLEPISEHTATDGPMSGRWTSSASSGVTRTVDRMPQTHRSSMYTYRSAASARSMYSSGSFLMSARSSVSNVSVVEVEMQRVWIDTEPVMEQEEFLHQEVTDREMQAQLQHRFRDGGSLDSAAKLLEEVEWEVEINRETSLWSRHLGTRLFGAPMMDWIICILYVSAPLTESVAVNQYSKNSICYFVVEPMMQAVFLMFWTCAALACPPNLLMAAASFLRLVVLALPLLTSSPWIISATIGVISPSNYLFIFYTFMGSSVGDIAKLAIRTGFILAVREEWEWMFKGKNFNFVVVDSITAISAIFFSILPGLALLRAPKLYREFRVPNLQFSWINRLRFLQLLGFGLLLQSLAFVSESALPVMRQTYPYRLEDRQLYFASLGLATVVPVVILSVILHRSPSYAMVVVKGLACFSLPAVALRCYAHYEADQSVELTLPLDILIFVSTALGGLSVYAVAVAVLATIGSRWRFVTYTSLFGVLANVGRTLSFGIVWLKTGHPDPLNSTYEQRELAWELFLVALPPCALAFFFRVAAFFFFDREATSMLRTERQRFLERYSMSRHSFMALEELASDSSWHTEASWSASEMSLPPSSLDVEVNIGDEVRLDRRQDAAESGDRVVPVANGGPLREAGSNRNNSNCSNNSTGVSPRRMPNLQAVSHVPETVWECSPSAEEETSIRMKGSKWRGNYSARTEDRETRSLWSRSCGKSSATRCSAREEVRKLEEELEEEQEEEEEEEEEEKAAKDEEQHEEEGEGEGEGEEEEEEDLQEDALQEGQEGESEGEEEEEKEEDLQAAEDAEEEGEEAQGKEKEVQAEPEGTPMHNKNGGDAQLQEERSSNDPHNSVSGSDGGNNAHQKLLDQTACAIDFAADESEDSEDDEDSFDMSETEDSARMHLEVRKTYASRV